MRTEMRAMNPPDDKTLADMEALAVELARGAGEILTERFGGSLSVEFKDERRRDPVTDADTAAQEYLVKGISLRFPHHGILGEEDEEGEEDASREAQDLLWVLDPLDGTKNFLHGLPVYASSVGAMHRGEPIVGAVFTSWPNGAGGIVHHARKGGGAFADGIPISVGDLADGGQLATIPGSFDRIHRLGRRARDAAADPRVTGSIAYELILAARGATKYMYTSNPHLWDIVGGVAVALEAGAAMMVGSRRGGALGIFPSISWRKSAALVDGWGDAPPSVRQLRRWARPLALGNPSAVESIAANMRFRGGPARAIGMRLRRRRRRR